MGDIFEIFYHTITELCMNCVTRLLKRFRSIGFAVVTSRKNGAGDDCVGNSRCTATLSPSLSVHIDLTP